MIDVDFRTGEPVKLRHPEWWLGHGCDVDGVFTVTEIIAGNFGSGFGVRVTPAIQPHHPYGADVLYDAAHFVRTDAEV